MKEEELKKENRTLHLPIKKKWFDMIASGEKKEEYREMKYYWINRVCNPGHGSFRKFDTVTLRNGYRKDSPVLTVECEGIRYGKGNPKWGALPGVDYVVIKLGKEAQCHSTQK